MATRKKKPQRPPAKLILAIDPAKGAGLAVFAEGKLVAYGPGAGDSFETLLQAARPLVMPYLLQYPREERLTVIEQHWKSFGKGSLTLGQRRGIAQSVGEALGFGRWEYVGASTWQSAIFGGKKVSDTKEASMAFVADTYGFMPLNNDISDAIAIGHYAVSKHL